MAKTIPERLLLTLEQLKEDELDNFKREVDKNLFGEPCFPGEAHWMGLKPKPDLGPLNPKELLDLILSLYEEHRALNLVICVLSAIYCHDLADSLTPRIDREEKEEKLPETGVMPKFHNLEVEERKNPEEFERFFRCSQCPREDRAVDIKPETILYPEGGYSIYRVNCTESGSFHCCITDLIFDVRAAVTLTYHFDSWPKHLNEEQRKHWVHVGPLLDIQADPEEAVAAIHVPHFLCLASKDHSEIHIAHFVKDGMSLEKPDRVEPFHLELKNPTFSPRGAVLRKPLFKRKIKVHAVALLYQDLRVPILKFHLYLLPNDSSLKMAVHEHELNYDSHRVRKPPETMKALTIGSHFFLEKILGVTVHPEKLEFKYLSADMEHQYLELFADHMEDALKLYLLENNKKELVWRAYVRREELYPVKVPNQIVSQTTDGPVVESKFCPTAAANRQTYAPLGAHCTPETTEKHQPSSPGIHFIEKHREELIG